MSENLDIKERSKFSKICSILVDVFFVPVLIFAFICSIMLFSAKSHNKVPTLFGTAMVEVLSNSMYPEYKKGDLLTIKTVNKDNLVVGDAIAFYAPEQSGFVYGEGKPMVIYHQIIRIIYAENENGVKIRYFVCKGTNVSPKTEYVLIEPNQDGAKGDYRLDSATGKYISKKEDGNLANSTYKNQYNYVAKLLDDDVKSDGNYDLDQVENEQMSVYQYVTDDMVVGVYNGRIGGLIASLIKLCTSSTGIIILVIIPSLLMIGLVVSGMIKESKDAKNNAERDRKALNEALNFENEEKELEEMSSKKDEKKEVEPEPKDKNIENSSAKEETKVEEKSSTLIETKDNKEETKVDAKEVKSSPVKKVPQVNAKLSGQTTPKTPLKKVPDKEEIKVEQTQKTEEKSKVSPKKVPPVSKVENKNVVPSRSQVTDEQPKVSVVPKKAPIKEQPKTPKKAPIKEQPKTPKKAPVKVDPASKVQVKVAPKKAPISTEKNEVKPKVAPKKVPPKKS